MANDMVVQNAPSCLLQVEIVSITALNLARMELELDLHLQQVGLNRFIEVACYTSGSNLENGFILK